MISITGFPYYTFLSTALPPSLHPGAPPDLLHPWQALLHAGVLFEGSTINPINIHKKNIYQHKISMVDAGSIMNIIFSEHAIFEMNRRKIKKEDIDRLIKNPQQKFTAKKNRTIIQGKYLDKGQNKEMMLRIIGEELESSFYVITTYKTSKIDKYWKGKNNESNL